LLLKFVGCDSDTKKNNDFILKNAPFKKRDLLVDSASNFQASVCLPKIGVNTLLCRNIKDDKKIKIK
jgi:hypothetical protein